MMRTLLKWVRERLRKLVEKPAERGQQDSEPGNVPGPTIDPESALTVEIIIARFCENVYKSVLRERPRVPDVERLRAYIQAGVAELKAFWLGPIDPEGHPTDAALLAEEQAAEAAVVAALNDVGRIQESQRAAILSVPEREPRPALAMPIIFFGVLSFTVAFGMTFIELPRLRQVEPLQAQLAIAAILGSIFACLIVFAAFNVRSRDDKAAIISTRGPLQQKSWQSGAGVIVIGAMLIMRLSLTSGMRQQLLSVGLGMAELGLYGYMREAAGKSRQEQEEYERQQHARGQRERQASVWSQFLIEEEAKLKTALAQQEKVREKRAARERRNFSLEAAIEHMTAAVKTTYFDALGDLKGRAIIGDVEHDNKNSNNGNNNNYRGRRDRGGESRPPIQ